MSGGFGGLAGDPAITVPPIAPDPIDSAIPYPLKGSLTPDPVRLLSATQRNLLGVFDAQTTLGFTDGKAPRAYVQGWTRTDETVLWPARLNQAAEFEFGCWKPRGATHKQPWPHSVRFKPPG